MIPIIPSMVLNCDSETSGLLTIHGNGNVMIIQIIPNRIINFAFCFSIFHYFSFSIVVLNSCEFI